MPLEEGKQRYGFLIVTGALLLTLTLTTILTVAVFNAKAIQSIERAHRVTLCILLTPAEDRTAELVRVCSTNPPTLEELPGIIENS